MKDEKMGEVEALTNFMMDIECLDPIYERIGDFNLFDILGITRTEIRHSNMLAWLLNPLESHGLGNYVYRRIIQNVLEDKRLAITNDERLRALLFDDEDIEVYREWKNIDILVISRKSRVVLCIENKVDSGEHDNQLKRYVDIIDKRFPESKTDYLKIFLFLSPKGTISSMDSVWIPRSYDFLIDIITKGRECSNISSDADVLIRNYIRAVKDEIMEDEELETKCREIYRKHQKALDLIYQYRPDKVSEIREEIYEWLKENKDRYGFIYEESRRKQWIKFLPKSTQQILVQKSKEFATPIWNWFYLGIYIEEESVQLFFELMNSDLTENQMLESVDLIGKLNGARFNKNSWKYRTVYNGKQQKLDRNDLTSSLQDAMENIMTTELGDLEKQLKVAIGN